MRGGQATAGVLALVVLAGGCSLLEQDDPRDDAEAFASALTAGRLDEVVHRRLTRAGAAVVGRHPRGAR